MNALDPNTALECCQRMLGAGLLVQTGELWTTRRVYGSSGALAGGPVSFGLGLRGLLSTALLVMPWSATSVVAMVIHFVLLGNSVWLTVRSRGPVCGGSDSMFFQVQLGLFAGALGFLHPAMPKLGLGWIAAQSVLSYFVAGLSKIRNAGWRNGAALQSLLTEDGSYELLAAARRLAKSKDLLCTLGWGLMLFELAFPAVLLAPVPFKWIFLGLGLVFHLANAAVLGLNRFIWAWVATYPALLYFA